MASHGLKLPQRPPLASNELKMSIFVSQSYIYVSLVHLSTRKTHECDVPFSPSILALVMRPLHD